VVSDLERGGRSAAASAAPVATPGAAQAPPETVRAMERVLRGFTAAAARDPALRAQAEGRDVTLHFVLRDLPLAFHLRLRGGTVAAGLGAPDGAAEVELAMPAAVLDGMLTGRVNAMQEALEGRLSFRGDTAKAMALQQLQRDLRRLYEAARAEAGGPGDLAALAAAAVAPSQVEAGDPRVEIVRTVQELYAQQLVTATGGNVSARIHGTDELWITPSALFKGDLRPEVMVRIDLEGRPLDPGARAPSSETLMHCAVYRARPEAQAVVHAHAVHAIILVNSGLPFLPISTEAAFFGDIPRIPFVMPGTQDLADAVAHAMKESWAVLMQNHGLLVAGRNLRRASDMTEIIDRSAQVILGCHAVGREPPVLPPEAVAELRRMGDLVA
jgi:autoinducer 2 (AI-2) kinase